MRLAQPVYKCPKRTALLKAARLALLTLSGQDSLGQLDPETVALALSHLSAQGRAKGLGYRDRSGLRTKPSLIHPPRHLDSLTSPHLSKVKVFDFILARMSLSGGHLGAPRGPILFSGSSGEVQELRRAVKPKEGSDGGWRRERGKEGETVG